MTLRWNCNTHGCYRNQIVDWAMLDGCFDQFTNLVSDWDGIVHQRGKFLFLEQKRPEVDLRPPLIRCINSAVAQGNAAIAFWCSDPCGKDVEAMRVWGVDGYDPKIKVRADLHALREAVNRWWRSVYVKGEM